jgi:hypothetical protein
LFLVIWPMPVLSWATQRVPFDACSDSTAAPHRDGARPGSGFSAAPHPGGVLVTLVVLASTGASRTCASA